MTNLTNLSQEVVNETLNETILYPLVKYQNYSHFELAQMLNTSSFFLSFLAIIIVCCTFFLIINYFYGHHFTNFMFRKWPSRKDKYEEELERIYRTHQTEQRKNGDLRTQLMRVNYTLSEKEKELAKNKEEFKDLHIRITDFTNKEDEEGPQMDKIRATEEEVRELKTKVKEKTKRIADLKGKIEELKENREGDIDYSNEEKGNEIDKYEDEGF